MTSIIEKTKMALSSDDKKYNGFAAFETQGKAGKYDIKPFSYPHKKFADDDLELKIEASGVCGSDLHTYVPASVRFRARADAPPSAACARSGARASSRPSSGTRSSGG